MDPWLLLGLLTLALSILSLRSGIRFSRELSRGRVLSGSDPPYLPRVSVVVPCKGAEEGLEENIRAILEQDYPDYEVLLVTADASDPACAPLASTLSEKPGRRARLLTAGPSRGMSEKIGNLLRGVGAARGESEVLVFLDSDIRPGRGFLRSLVAPLGEPSVGASTGYRWLAGGEGLWPSLARLWNAGILPLMTDPRLNFAWGGATAVRRDDFLRLGIAERWKGTLSDDLILSAAVREAGLRIQFAPRALTQSPVAYGSFKEVFRWTNRQLTILRWYARKLWALIAAAHLFYDLMTGAAAALALGAAFRGSPPPLAVPLLLSHIPAGCLKAWVVAAASEGSLKGPPLSGPRLYPLLQPLASWLVSANLIFSLRANRVTWRGVTYELRASGEVRVISRKNLKEG